MFESDDFDQVLSQFDFPEVATVNSKEKENTSTNHFAENFKVTSHSDILPPLGNKTDVNSLHTLCSKPDIDRIPEHPKIPLFNNKPGLNKATPFYKKPELFRVPPLHNELEIGSTPEINVTNRVTLNQTDIKYPKLHTGNSPLNSEKNLNEQNKICNDSNIEHTNDKPRQENITDSNSSTFAVPKQNKRKIINSYFDHQSKRKFPGPAGLLTGALEVPKDDSICQIELLSQDIDCTEHNLRKDLFDSPIWSRLLSDILVWKLDINSIQTIKHQALSGNLTRRKAQNVTAFVETVDRSAIDPLIILRDATGSIKCTLHRDAWSTFSQYLVSDCCALILQKPTVLTTGGAFKKHYLNITLSNILAIYSSTVISADGNRTLPDGYSFIHEDEFTVIKTENCTDQFSLGTHLKQSNASENLIDGLDSFFSEDIF